MGMPLKQMKEEEKKTKNKTKTRGFNVIGGCTQIFPQKVPGTLSHQWIQSCMSPWFHKLHQQLQS